MKFFKLILVVLAIFPFSGCASAVDGIHVEVKKKNDLIYAVSVENGGRDAVEFSVAVEINDDGQWVEYPHRLEDGLLEPRRKIHSLMRGEAANFVLDLERDARESPAIPVDEKEQRSIHRARIRVKQFGAGGKVKLITSDAFNLLVR